MHFHEWQLLTYIIVVVELNFFKMKKILRFIGIYNRSIFAVIVYF